MLPLYSANETPTCIFSRNEEMRQQSIGTILEFISNGLYRIHSCKPWPSFSSLVDSDARRTYTDFLLEYWYVWTVLFLFWPVFLNLFIAFATASGWIFWLFASVAVGIIQVVYAAYQFIVIFGDIVGLSILKTFAMLRAQALRLSFMSGMHIGKARKHNRRREWKRMLARATSYEKYCSILVEVPLSEDRSSVSMGNSGCWSFRFGLKNGPALPPHSQREALHVNGNEMLTSGACTDAYDNTSDKLDIASNGIKKRIPRVSSCATFSAGMLKQSYFQASSRTSRKSVDSSMHHSMSTANLPDDATSISSSSEEESEEDRRFRNCVEATLGMRGGMLVATTNRLREARIQASTESDTSTLKFLLPAVVKRNHLSVDDYLIDDARSVAESGRCRLPKEAKDVIYGFVDEVVKCLYWLSESPCLRELADLTRTSRRNSIDDGIEIQELSERIELVSKMRLNIGSTALMLSGGGAQAMYHLGTIRALVESATYDQIPVISGTSGGAITAAMCAMATGDEMVRDVCVPSVSTDFRRSGVMGKQNIRWFPTLWEMGAFWLKNRLLVDSKEFRRCCEYYFGDTTFEEAFRKTGKHVCIHVSASRAQSGAGTQRLLLNHISTPHVTISSAVAASCALPGVMKPVSAHDELFIVFNLVFANTVFISNCSLNCLSCTLCGSRQN